MDWTCCILQLCSSSFLTSLARLVRIMSSLYSSERGETVQNPGGKGQERAWDCGASGMMLPGGSSEGSCFFHPKMREPRKPATLTDKGKEKQKAKLPHCYRTGRASWAGGNVVGWGRGPRQPESGLTPPSPAGAQEGAEGPRSRQERAAVAGAGGCACPCQR